MLEPRETAHTDVALQAALAKALEENAMLRRAAAEAAAEATAAPAPSAAAAPAAPAMPAAPARPAQPSPRP
jgi:ribosomal protein L12E/L44/L45/RPP1/RPP2